MIARAYHRLPSLDPVHVALATRVLLARLPPAPPLHVVVECRGPDGVPPALARALRAEVRAALADRYGATVPTLQAASRRGRDGVWLTVARTVAP